MGNAYSDLAKAFANVSTSFVELEIFKKLMRLPYSSTTSLLLMTLLNVLWNAEACKGTPAGLTSATIRALEWPDWLYIACSFLSVHSPSLPDQRRKLTLKGRFDELQVLVIRNNISTCLSLWPILPNVWKIVYLRDQQE